jgi:hypothetical protein
MASQLTDTILLVRPESFSFNEETAGSNVFQSEKNADESVLKKALNEFDSFVETLRSNDVNVLILEYGSSIKLPDAVYPNNWFVTHEGGTVILFPMLAENRRKERDAEKLVKLFSSNGMMIKNLIDISGHEKENLFLEGTGSLVLDRKNKVVYSIESERTSKKLFDDYCDMMKIKNENRIFFHANDRDGNPIYHTDVIMSIGDGFTVICEECIPMEERNFVLQKLSESKLEIIKINYDQLYNFCGNILNVKNKKGESIIVMSTKAFNNFTPQQRKTLEQFGKIIHSDISTIENVGGGSARCMMAEIFL